MTDFDKQLIAKAEQFRRWDYRGIDVLMAIADTKEARDRLYEIQMELYDFVRESL